VSDTLVLCYHGVSEDWPADFSISPGRLADQVRWFLDRGYRPATFTAAATGQARGRVLAVTFDDAYRSVGRLAFPLLSELGVPATVFAPTGFVDDPVPRGWDGTHEWAGTAFAAEIAVMGWSGLEELAEAGWEIGSHTRTHPRLTELDDQTLRDELGGSREELEARLGRPCRSLAYPYGDVDRRVAKAAGEAGYSAAGGVLPGRASERDPLLFPRISVGRGWADETLRRRVRPWQRRLQSSALWPAVPPLLRLARTVRGVARD
jgi:peptidoglycan/xylan/chitin deacetylase (PgdA/CDA1 family)